MSHQLPSLWKPVLWCSESKRLQLHSFQQVPAFRSCGLSPFEVTGCLCRETKAAWCFFRFWNPPALYKHQDTGLGPKPLPQQRAAKAMRWLTYTAVPELSKCKEVWLSMISTPFSCNTPSCVCNVFVSASKPLVQQDPAVRKTKETQPRTATPWHLPLKKHRALKDFFFFFLLPLSLLPPIFVIPGDDCIYLFASSQTAGQTGAPSGSGLALLLERAKQWGFNPGASSSRRWPEVSLGSQHGTVASFMKRLWDEPRIATPKAFPCCNGSPKWNAAENTACNAPSYWDVQCESLFLPGLGCVCCLHAICE